MRVTQQDRVLEYLKTHKTMTRQDAVNHIGCHKLPTVVGLLRRKGYRITGVMTDSTNRFGDPVKFMTYTLEDDDENN